jgi:hypothetical protein
MLNINIGWYYQHTTAELGLDEFQEGDYSLENSCQIGQGNELNGQAEVGYSDLNKYVV